MSALPGGNGVLELEALTLQEGPDGAVIYAALRNVGEVPACSAAFSVELFDADGQSLAAGIGGLLTQGSYRLNDDTGAIAACVGPGEVTMAAVTELSPAVRVDDVSHAVYRCPYHALEVTPIEGITLDDVTAAGSGGGSVFTGTLHNGLPVALVNPSVTVFPVSRVGRPLGVASAHGDVEVPPGGQWPFETGAVDTAGVERFAFAAGALGDR